MKISIVMACFNRVEVISRALASLRSQSFNNVELVVVDGGSLDGTTEVFQSFLHPGDFFVSEPDGGIYDALNKGLAAVSGEVVGFLHSDDFYFDEEVLSKVACLFDESEADIVFGNVEFFRPGQVERVTRSYRCSELSVKMLSWGFMPAHPAMFFRREVFQDLGGFKTGYKIAGDYEFLCRVASSGRFKAIHVDLPLLRMSMGGISSSGLKSSVRLNREVYKALMENGIYSNYFMILSKYFFKVFEFLRLGQ